MPTFNQPEKIRAAVVAGAVILLVGWSAHLSSGGGVPMFPASIGASAVIVFAMPHSPAAKPWPLLGGHLLSATVGIACARWIAPLWLAAALAMTLSLLLMQQARCLHPPGGASALIPVLGGETVQALGFEYLLRPLALNLALLLLASLLYQKWLAKPPLPMQRFGITAADLHAALADMGEFIDVGERELAEIFQRASARAFHREFGELTAAKLMAPNPLRVEFGTALEEAWDLMQQHRLQALPVVDRGCHVIGIVTRSDFFRHAGAEHWQGMGGKLRQLLRATLTVHSRKPEVVGQIMSTPVLTVQSDQPLDELARLLAERGVRQLPVVSRRNKLVGLVTSADLIAALCQTRLAATTRPAA